MTLYISINLSYILLLFFFSILLVVSAPLGNFFGKVLLGEKTFLNPLFGAIERLVYKTSGVDDKVEMNWKEYTKCLLVFNAMGFLLLMGLQLFQSHLPFTGQTHLLDHVVGDILYEQRGAAGLAFCKDYFLGACYHAIILRVIAEKGITSTEDLLKECGKIQTKC